MAALLQFEHGCRLSHLTFRFLRGNTIVNSVLQLPDCTVRTICWRGVGLFAFAEAESLGIAVTLVDIVL